MNTSGERGLWNSVKTKIDALNHGEVVVVDGFVTALKYDVEEELLPGSWLATAGWAEAFLARLKGHHALSETALSSTQFEAAFNKACDDVGFTVEETTNATERFFDTTIIGPFGRKALSLKASSAKDMSRKAVHISKLTEAAWIQDARRQKDRQHELLRLFREYREATDAIIMLRGFRNERGYLYELVEIPTTLFESVDKLSVANAQHGTIPMPPDAATPTWKIRVDGSDAKITLTGIDLSVCTVHGRWQLWNNDSTGEG